MEPSQFPDQTLVLIVLDALLIYFLIGGIIAWRYGKKASQIFFSATGRCPDEAALGVLQGLMMVTWPFLAPYEWVTRFKNWRKP